jgi:serine/threonine-protein kinase
MGTHDNGPQHQVAFVHGSGPHLSAEIEQLLRQRMRWAGVFAMGLIVLFAVRDLFAHSTTVGTRSVSFAPVLAVAIAVLVWRLWVRRPAVLLELRIIEGTLVGSVALFLAMNQYLWMAGGHVLAYVQAGERDQGKIIVAHHWALLWFFLAVMYGVFIPNTWRRCAVVVGILCSLPLLITLVVVLAEPARASLLLGQVFGEMAIWMVVAAVLAVYGSHKLGLLRQKVFEAEKLGQYQLKRRLGEGGMGEVYLAEHQLLRRTCAVKFIRSEQAGNAANLARFEREVKAMASLTHWNSVEVFDYGRTDDGTLYYVMEYLPGTDLQNMVDCWGALPPERVIHLMRQVCAALAEAHSIGLVHRDIKPGNIMLCRRGRVFDVVKLLDFGLVRLVQENQAGERVTVQGSILGTPHYMSPEQATGTDHIDARSDIYSVGAVAFFLLTGRPVFAYDSLTRILAAHMMEPPPHPTALRPDISTDLADVVSKCLQKDPSQRYATVEALDQALAACRNAGEWTPPMAAAWWQQSTQPAEPAGPTEAAALSEAPPATCPG